MYLSKVVVDSHDSYEQHQAVWSLFPGTPDRKRDYLFRVEDDNGSKCTLLLQSSTKPTSSELAQVLACKEFTPRLSVDGHYKFKILAYPTKCLSQGKKVVEIKDEGEQVAWLQRKLTGANVQVTAMENRLVRSKKSFNSKFVCFEGVLQVLNSGKVEAALVMGIGRKKHAGAGMLSLAKIS